MSLPKRNSLLWSSPCVLVDLRNGISQSNHGNPCWLRKTLVEQGDQKSQSYRKSILNIHWKDCCWSSNTLATWCEELAHWKRPWCWERLKAEGEGENRGGDGWMASLTWWTWVSASSGSRWWTGRPGVLQSMGSQRVGHKWVTEQQQNDTMTCFSFDCF